MKSSLKELPGPVARIGEEGFFLEDWRIVSSGGEQGVGPAGRSRRREGRNGRGRKEGIHELQNAIIGICPRGITIDPPGLVLPFEWVVKLLYRVCNLSSMKPAISYTA